jgi:arylsulfatase A-like enzyme
VNEGPLGRPLLFAALAGGAWVACLEAGALWARHDVSGIPLAWLGAATLALSALGLACALPLWLLAARLRRGAAAPAERRRPWYAGAALAGSVLLHVLNVSLYVRLYLGVHVLLSAATLLLAQLGWVLLIVPLAQTPGAARRRVELLAIVAGAGVLIGCLVQVTMDIALRTHALEQGTVLAHELLALDRATGILGSTQREVSGTLDPEVRAALEPRPLLAPSGVARGANVVLVTIDSLRADRWQAGGARAPQLGALEALGSEGVRFARAYAPSCWTIHSMSAVLFGRLPSQLRFTPLGVDAGYRFMPFSGEAAKNPLNFKRMTPAPFADQGPGLVDALRDAGYQTATIPAYIFYFRGAGLTKAFEYVDEDGYRDLGFGPSGIAPVPLVQRAERFLDGRDTKRPFFLWLHFMEPHAPYEAQDEAARGGSAEKRYDSELRRADAGLAALRKALVSRRLDAQTIWIVHGDHGEEFGDHGGSFHASTLYEEIVHVPLVVRLPPAPAARPRTVPQPVSLLDLGPTLLDVLGVSSQAARMGRSLAPSLAGSEQPPRPIVMECERFSAHKRAYLRWPFKLIVDGATGTNQLFALPGDPHERRNLAGEEPAILQHMGGELAQLEQLMRGAWTEPALRTAPR